MIRIIGKIPAKVTIACSGGIDSMAFTNFLLQGKREVKLAYFNHDTKHGKDAEKFVKEYAEKNDIDTDKKAIGVYKHKGNIGSTRKFAQSRARSAGGKSGLKFELYKASDENQYGIAVMDK